MKKLTGIMSAVCAAAAAMTVCAAMPLSASAAEIRLTGDFNNDKVVGVEDAQYTLEMYAEAVAGNADFGITDETANLDINMDGKLSAADAEYILQYYCQTLVGGKPLWAEVRNLSYQDGSEFYGIRETFVVDEDYHLVLDEDGQPIPIIFGERLAVLKGLYIEAGCAAGAPGETVSVPIYVAGLPKLAGFQLLIQHDLPLELISIESDIANHPEWNDILKNNPQVNPKFSENEGCIVAAQAYNIALRDGYIIARYEYRIPEDAKAGDVYSISVAPYYTKFVTDEGVDYQYTTLSGAVRVTDAK